VEDFQVVKFIPGKIVKTLAVCVVQLIYLKKGCIRFDKKYKFLTVIKIIYLNKILLYKIVNTAVKSNYSLRISCGYIYIHVCDIISYSKISHKNTHNIYIYIVSKYLNEIVYD
jgi:hypothetical protein